MRVLTRVTNVIHFGADSIINQTFLDSSLSLKFGLDILDDPGVDPWHSDKESDFDSLAIILQLQWISA